MKKKRRKPEMEVLKETVGPPIEEDLVKVEESNPPDGPMKFDTSTQSLKVELGIHPAPCEHDDVQIGLGGHQELTIRGCKLCRRVEIDLFDPWKHDKGKRPNGDEYNVKRVLRGLVISKGK